MRCNLLRWWVWRPSDSILSRSLKSKETVVRSILLFKQIVKVTCHQAWRYCYWSKTNWDDEWKNQEACRTLEVVSRRWATNQAVHLAKLWRNESQNRVNEEVMMGGWRLKWLNHCQVRWYSQRTRIPNQTSQNKSQRKSIGTFTAKS